MAEGVADRNNGMVKRMKVDGGDATVAFFDDQMNPTSEENATEAEIIFDDGRHVFVKLDDCAAPNADARRTKKTFTNKNASKKPTTTRMGSTKRTASTKTSPKEK